MVKTAKGITCIQENGNIIIKHGSEVVAIVKNADNVNIHRLNSTSPVIIQAIDDDIDEELLRERMEQAQNSKHYSIDEAREKLGL